MGSIQRYRTVCTTDVLFPADDVHEPQFNVDGWRFGRRQVTRGKMTNDEEDGHA